jgi:hypothetical protein
MTHLFTQANAVVAVTRDRKAHRFQSRHSTPTRDAWRLNRCPKGSGMAA